MEKPIHDIELEKLVLGTLLTDKHSLNQVRDILSEDCFDDPFNRNIFKALMSVEDSGFRADIMSVRQHFDKFNMTYTMDGLLDVSSKYTFDICQHSARLHELNIRRQFYRTGHYLMRKAADELESVEDIETTAKDRLSDAFKLNDRRISTIHDGIRLVMDNMNENMKGGRSMTGTPTGFGRFDSRSGGLQKSDLIVIAGETSSGKSSLALSIAGNAAAAGSRIAVYSLEMTVRQLTARMISSKSGVPSNAILYAHLDRTGIESVNNGIAGIEDYKLFFDDRSTSNIDNILSSIRYMKARYGIDGAIVDYLQILNVNMKGTNKEQQMGDVARRLKNLAKELDVWIIALSQMNRDNNSSIPTLARLRDSGQIAEAADIVMLIHRPEIRGGSYPDSFKDVSTQGTAMIDVAKGRNVGIMKFICGFDAPTTTFYNLDSYPSAHGDNNEERDPF